jgi:hypothetical protein
MLLPSPWEYENEGSKKKPGPLNLSMIRVPICRGGLQSFMTGGKPNFGFPFGSPLVKAGACGLGQVFWLAGLSATAFPFIEQWPWAREKFPKIRCRLTAMGSLPT